MLERKMAEKVFKEIVNQVSPAVVTLEQVEKAVPFGSCGIYQYYRFEYGDLAILVMVGKDTCRVKTVAW